MKRNLIVSLEKLPLFFTMMIIFFWDVIDDLVSQGPLILLILIAVYIVVRNKTLRLYEAKSACIVLSLLLIHGMITVMLRTNQMDLFLMQFMALLASFVCFMVILSPYPVETVIHYYYGMSFIAAIVAIFQQIIVVFDLKWAMEIPYLFDFVRLHEQIEETDMVRVSAFFGEPSFLVYSLCPAVYIALLVLFGKRKREDWTGNRLIAFVLVLGFFISFSSIGYLGIVFMILLMNIKWLLKPKGIAAIAVAAIFVGLVYFNIDMVKVRVDDTIEAVFTEDINEKNLAEINLSSYTLVSHMRLAQKTFVDSAGFGCGLGSYELSFDRGMEECSAYIYEIKLNREDANSLLFRVFSELGILGLILIVAFIGRYYPRGSSQEYLNYSYALLVLFALRLLRQGNYVHGGAFFFVCLYICIFIESRNSKTELRLERM